jgi:hypothetical protein
MSSTSTAPHYSSAQRISVVVIFSIAGPGVLFIAFRLLKDKYNRHQERYVPLLPVHRAPSQQYAGVPVYAPVRIDPAHHLLNLQVPMPAKKVERGARHSGSGQVSVCEEHWPYQPKA